MCKKNLPLESFGSESNRRDGKSFVCKICKKAHYQHIQYLKTQSPPPPSNCQCCNKQDSKLHFDHDHNTGLYRGWLCKNCNLGIGQLGDNLEGLMKAVTYLSNTTNGNQI